MSEKNEVRIPKRLEQRPHWRGLPVPYIALMRDDQTPDFRVTDEHKRRSVMLNKWCQLCGQPLGRFMFFTGGTEAAKTNAYFEPGCHLDCLIYAMQVCPFIVGKMEHVPIEKIQKQYAEQYEVGRVAGGGAITIKADDAFAAVRNPLWVIKKATDYLFVKTKEGTILMRPIVIKQTPPMEPEKMLPPDWNKVFKWLMA